MIRPAILALAAVLTVAAAGVDEELLQASRKGELAAVKALCEKGAAIEAKTPYGQTPLYLAAMNGHDEVVRFLISKGAQTDVKDTFYKASILDFVLDRKHYDVARTLIASWSGNPDEELATVAQGEHPDLLELVLAKSKPSQAALDKTYEAALDRKQEAIATVLKKSGAHEPAPPAVIDPKILESYAGNYKAEQLPFDIKVFVKDGKLYLQATGQSEFAPKPKTPTSFEYSQFQLQIDFESSTAFTIKQGSRQDKFKKVAAQ